MQDDLEVLEARESIIQEIIWFQRYAFKCYLEAMFHKDQYLDGCETNCLLYERAMKQSSIYYTLARRSLLIL